MGKQEKKLEGKIQRLVDKYALECNHAPKFIIEGYHIRIEKGERLLRPDGRPV